MRFGCYGVGVLLRFRKRGRQWGRVVLEVLFIYFSKTGKSITLLSGGH